MNILWLKTELLHPVDKGGKIRTYQMLKQMKQDHNVLFLTLDDGTAAPDAFETACEYSTEAITIRHPTAAKFSSRFYREVAANLLSDLPYFMAKYRSNEMLARFEQILREREIDIVVCDFLMPSINLPASIEKPSVLFQHNVEAAIWKRHTEIAGNVLKKRYLKGQWKRTVRYESATCRKFDSVVAVSTNDAEVFASEYKAEHVYDIPTGVDTDFFLPSSGHRPSVTNIVFTGSMDWLPNQDAIEWFIEGVMPIVRMSIPDATLTIVGRDPFPSLIERARNDPAIRVTGRVPDVRPYMREASVYAVPIRIGGGTRLKLYEAMAMELPIVSTTVGAEGLPVSDGEELLLRDSEVDFAAAIVKIAGHHRFAEALGKRAGERVRRDFGWKQVAERFAAICEDTMRRSTK